MPADFDKLMRSINTSKKKHPAAKKALDEARRNHAVVISETEKRIEAYNKAWLASLIEYMEDRGMGWCGSVYAGHPCKEKDLRGYAHWGTHWVGSEYYEREESFHHTGVQCRACLSRSSGSSNSKSLLLDVGAVWRYVFKDACNSYSSNVPVKILELAEKAGIPPRIKLTYSQGVKKYTLNDEVILEVR